MLLTYRTSAPTPVSLQPKLEVVQGQSKEPIRVNNGLRFELQLKPRETRYLDFVMAGNSKLYPETERNRMAAEDFQKALRKAESRWDQALEPGMKLSTPEPRLNNIYKHLILSCLQNVPKEPNVPWLMPQHSSGYAGGVWPCEFVKVSVPLDSLGFHKDTEACLRWFTEHQSGVGKYGNKDIGPDGEMTSTHGCFVGANSPRWMCETGVVLWMLAVALSLFARRRLAEGESGQYACRLRLDSEAARHDAHHRGRRKTGRPFRTASERPRA